MSTSELDSPRVLPFNGADADVDVIANPAVKQSARQVKGFSLIRIEQ
ncbi:MAG: hypothetical protein O3C21_09000 [Verrucomicrobia bacterium]|nr:hypothetical protein [Verrucomicrobiota bacterium]